MGHVRSKTSSLDQVLEKLGVCCRGHIFSPIIAPPGWLSGEHVGLTTWWLRIRSPVEVTFLSAYFRLLPLQEHVGKVVDGFGKKSCVSTSERKPGNTYASSTAMK